jgi:predicted RNA-binding Zn-ribbon protein involved in translation (DUF1610 family)
MARAKTTKPGHLNADTRSRAGRLRGEPRPCTHRSRSTGSWRRASAARNSLDNPGFCIACGAEVDGVEPDACQYECEACGKHAVYGAEELLIMGNPLGGPE